MGLVLVNLLSCLYFAYIQRRRVLSIYGPLNHPAMHATRLAARTFASPTFASPTFASPTFASPTFASPTFASPTFALPKQLGHLGPIEQIELGKLDKSRFPFSLPRTLIQRVCSRRQIAHDNQQRQHEFNKMSNYGNSYNNSHYDPQYDPQYDPYYIHPYGCTTKTRN
jgi:hypothetical protein